jgi:hypothetical protein
LTLFSSVRNAKVTAVEAERYVQSAVALITCYRFRKGHIDFWIDAIIVGTVKMCNLNSIVPSWATDLDAFNENLASSPMYPRFGEAAGMVIGGFAYFTNPPAASNDPVVIVPGVLHPDDIGKTDKTGGQTLQSTDPFADSVNSLGKSVLDGMTLVAGALAPAAVAAHAFPEAPSPVQDWTRNELCFNHQ